MDKITPYAKFVVAVVGAGITAALQITDPGTDLFKYLTIASAIVTAVAVYAVPNAKPSRPLALGNSGLR